MAISKIKSKRKISGGRLKFYRKKKLSDLCSVPRFTKIGEKKVKSLKLRGKNFKDVLLNVNVANILDPKTNKYSKLKILGLVENSANRNFVRRNTITKGAIFKTEKGNAKVTNRPSQESIVNAKFI